MPDADAEVDSEERIEERMKAIEGYLSRYHAANPEEYGDSPEQEEVVLEAMQQGIIPDHQRKHSPPPYATYFRQIFNSQIRKAISLYLDEGSEAVEEKLTEFREMKNPVTATDGSKGQWAAYNRYCQEAHAWLLGIHPQQQESGA